MLRFINTVQPGGIEIMQNTNVGVETFSEDRQPRLPYHAPELISLGQIQSIVQFGSACGTDGRGGACCAS